MRQRSVTHWLIRHAAHRAPASLSARLEEEWLADLAERTSGLSRLGFAIGCCWATRVIAYEHQPSRVTVSSAALGPKNLIAYADQHFGFISLRSRTFLLVVSLHALLFYGFMTALSHTHKNALPDPLQNQELKSPVRHELPVPLPDPQLKRVPIEVPQPDTDIPYEPDPRAPAVLGSMMAHLSWRERDPDIIAFQRKMAGP